MPNPPPFSLPPSTQIPNIHPYNKLVQPQNSSASTSSASATKPAGSVPPKSPEVRTSQPTSSSGTARPFGATSADMSDLERQRRSAELKYPYIARPPSSETSAPAASHAPHHHHHHHHHHTHATTSTSATTTPTPSAPAPPAAQQPRRDGLGYGVGRFGGYGLFGGFRDIDRVHRETEKPDKDRQERERLEKEKKAPTSPVARTSASPFARPGQPTSPTVSRATPGAAGPTSPKATTSHTARPNLPMPGYGSMGSRALPSPFDRDRSASASVDPPAAHHRTGSSSSNREAVSATSPQTSTAPIAGRNSFSGTQPAPARSPADSPSTASKPNPVPAAKPTYSAYSAYQPPYMSYGSGFTGYSAFGGGSWVDRERAKAKERERVRENEKLAQLNAEKRKQEAQRAADPYRPPSATPSRIEVLNTPEPPQTAYPAGSDAASQAVPSREPRPYTYSAKPEQSPAPAKDYTYQPRDKRPRMDAVVDDARRGASKAKRRKDDDKASPTSTRDLTSLTREVRKWPEVRSRQVENWLTNNSDWQRVLKTVSHEVYQGADWSLAQGQSTQVLNEGMKVFVRINGAFLGPSWVLRGEKGWDEAVPHPPVDVELGRGLEKRGVWGTDVYTDDSDLGLVLVHAGWIRWMNTAEVMNRDVIEVKVRVVPKLVRYFASERNGVRTRSWGNGHDGASVVVEGVKRLKVTPKELKRNRKLHLAELAQQRKAVLGQPLETDQRILNGAQRPIVFTRMGAALKYDPSALSGCFNLRPTDETRYNLFTHDLEFISGKDHYLLHSVNSEEPIQLHLKQYLSTEPVRTSILAEYVVQSEVHLTPDGLAIELKDGKGLFIKVEGFIWKMPPSQSVFSDPGTTYSDTD